MPAVTKLGELFSFTVIHILWIRSMEYILERLLGQKAVYRREIPMLASKTVADVEACVCMFS
jgi:hypothetical protein